MRDFLGVTASVKLRKTGGGSYVEKWMALRANWGTFNRPGDGQDMACELTVV